MAHPNIEAILEEGDITVGRVGPIECVASASTSYDCPVLLVRREGESFVALLHRLDRAVAGRVSGGPWLFFSRVIGGDTRSVFTGSEGIRG